jgi:hypothetical protein
MQPLGRKIYCLSGRNSMPPSQRARRNGTGFGGGRGRATGGGGGRGGTDRAASGAGRGHATPHPAEDRDTQAAQTAAQEGDAPC